jgi:uncharacterized membrane protein YccC
MKPYEPTDRPAVDFIIGAMLGAVVMFCGLWLAFGGHPVLATGYVIVGAGMFAYGLANYMIRKL